ncbi:rCG39875 [Rattus norvegicus]|uniref:RCG39875 n=1 Tax=Rattus norvegicus TaxID=10116 RepID=A6I656_RAT|nr:rCG39875 [Rattus norvegicus]
MEKGERDRKRQTEEREGGASSTTQEG